MPPDLPQLLAARLQHALPGPRAQRAFEAELSYGRHFGPPSATARDAAVVVLLYQRAGQWYVPLTARPESMPQHAGQISLPGGGVDPGETSERAALRELNEELGVASDKVELLGQLSPIYLFNSDFLVTPWLAVARGDIEFRPHDVEVAELLEVPLAHLLDPANVGSHVRRKQGVALVAPHFVFGPHQIWGATSMILAELVALVNEALSPGASESPHSSFINHRSSLQ